MYTCEICNKSYETQRSLASHKNHHNPDYHHRSKQGALSSQKKASEIAKNQLVENTKEKYKDSICLHCGKPLSYEKSKQRNKFCDRSCAASYNNSIKPKREKSKKIRKPYNKDDFVKEQFCKICSSSFFRRNPTKTCSLNCYKQLISNIGKNYENKHFDRRHQSFLEKSFEMWLNKNYPNISYIKEKSFPIFNPDGSKDTTFFGDFYFPDKNVLIEMDGNYHNTPERKLFDKIRDEKIVNQYNCKILRISHKEHMKCLKIDEVRSLLN